MFYTIDNKKDYDLQKGQQLFAKALEMSSDNKLKEILSNATAGILWGCELNIYINDIALIEQCDPVLLREFMQLVLRLDDYAQNIVFHEKKNGNITAILKCSLHMDRYQKTIFDKQ